MPSSCVGRGACHRCAGILATLAFGCATEGGTAFRASCPAAFLCVGDFLPRLRTTTANIKRASASSTTTAPIVHIYASNGFCDDGVLVGVCVLGSCSVFACSCVYVRYGFTALKSGYLVVILVNSCAALCQWP